MNQVYLAMESMAAVVVLVLLLANAFEHTEKSKKRNVFIRLLIANEVVILMDAISWLHLRWQDKQILLVFLVAMTYIVPFYALATFSRYLYEHLAERSDISRTPFRLITVYAFGICILTCILCVSGNMFTVQDGVYQPGMATGIYYICYIFSLVFFAIIILLNGMKFRVSELLGALSFCVLPLVAILISMSPLGINLAIPGMAIEVLVIYVSLKTEQEHTLLHQAIFDEMTGVYNRRAYEDHLLHRPEVPVEPDFCFASIDINELKQANDNIGHAAGDELICGAAYCLQRTLGKHGEIYRVGGDEFIAIFFADAEKFEFLKQDLELVTDSWRGQLVDSLAISVGYATKREFQTETIDEIVKTAEARMYQAKEEYYANKGVDRRGMAAAHAALCNLYTKILKVNLTKDTYTIVNMDMTEQTKEKGFADTISEWLSGFGKSGLVHADDLDIYLQKTDINYLKAYFKEGKASFGFWYRRKYEDGFKKVAMELIPADDYSEDNQSLYLYVKSIDM